MLLISNHSSIHHWNKMRGGKKKKEKEAEFVRTQTFHRNSFRTHGERKGAIKGFEIEILIVEPLNTVFLIHFRWQILKKVGRTDKKSLIISPWSDLIYIYIYIYIRTCIYIYIYIMVWVFTYGPGDRGSIPVWVIAKTQEWYFIPPCLKLSILRYGSMIKWSNPGNGIAPSPTSWCSSYWKGSLRFIPDYGRQLYFLYITWQSLWLSVSCFLHLSEWRFSKKTD